MKYVSIFIAFIVFIVLSVLGFRLISNQIKSLDDKQDNITQIELSELKKPGVKLRYSIKGPIVAEENRKELVFEIGQGARSVKLLKGYNQVLEKEQQLSNNYGAYDAFAGALFKTGFITERTNISNTNYDNECPTGKVYRAELIDANNKVVKSLWRVSCDSKLGTMTANPASVLELFKKQFPDYKTFASDITID